MSDSHNDADIVITGLGTVTPIGADVESFWAANLAGTSGLAWEKRMDLSDLPCGWVAGLIPEDTREQIMARWSSPGRQWHDMLMHAAVDQALSDARLDDDSPGRIGLVWTRVGSGPGGPFPEDYIGYMKSLAARFDAVGDDPATVLDYLTKRRTGGGMDVSTFPKEMSERLRRPLSAIKVDATCAGGLRAVAEASRLLKLGKMDYVIVSATTSRNTQYVISQYAQLMALSRWKGKPEQASMPFDRRRTGMVINESSGALVLETAAHAAARGIDTVHAVVGGWGLAVDASHVTKPRAEMIEHVIQGALHNSGTDVEGVDVVNAHATSTKLNDLMEARALHKVFGKRLPDMQVCAVKSLTGHGSATSGVTETAIAALTMNRGIVPPVVTCTEPDPACDVNTSLTPVHRPVRTVLKNSFGFGGQYAAMIYKRPENPRPMRVA